MKWISVNEKLPVGLADVAVKCEGGKVFEHTMYFEDNGVFVSTEDFMNWEYIEENVTHWMYKETLMEIPKGIKEFREYRGMTPKQLAEASGVDYSRIRKLERGEIKAANMTAKSLLSIADALGVDIHLLLEEYD